MDLKNIFKWGAIGTGGAVVASQAGKIIKGVLLGIALLLLGSFITWKSATSVDENSKEVEELELESAKDVDSGDRGLVKIYGQVSSDNTLNYELEDCSKIDCYYEEGDIKEYSDLLYYKAVIEQFQLIEKEKTTTDANGKTTTTTEYEEDWVELEDFRAEEWADIEIEGIEITPKKAKVRVDYKKDEISSIYLEDAPEINDYGRSVSDQVGKIRASVTYLEEDDREYIVVGELRSSGISSGDPFVFTDQDDSEIIDTLEGEESATRWGMRIFAFIILVIAFTSILSPILAFTDLIPLVGGAARGLAAGLGAIVSIILMLIIITIANFWIILVLIGVLAGVFLLQGKNIENKVRGMVKEKKELKEKAEVK
ncbi:MAG: TMEM43 family protein [Candidatus Dojkabacteria bacterium]|nr:TMEM43 family protein [Candidatus Dojkabacteria bacterium]MDQ7021320.1 TMEM43 family protein [Candidatus Dojkabacteria bacterium]